VAKIELAHFPSTNGMMEKHAEELGSVQVLCNESLEYVWAGKLGQALPLLAAIPETKQEMKVYS
jgi:hypothetical protein